VDSQHKSFSLKGYYRINRSFENHRWAVLYGCSASYAIGLLQRDFILHSTENVRNSI